MRLAAGPFGPVALVCTGLAYILCFYFRLMGRVGPTHPITMTILIPAFAVLRGWGFLDEAVTSAMLAGCVLVGTALVTSLIPRGKPQVGPSGSERESAP